MFGLYRRPKVIAIAVPEDSTLADLAENPYPVARMLARNILTLQRQIEMLTVQCRDYEDRIAVLEGNPDSKSGGTVTNELVGLRNRIRLLEGNREDASRTAS